MPFLLLAVGDVLFHCASLPLRTCPGEWTRATAASQVALISSTSVAVKESIPIKLFFPLLTRTSSSSLACTAAPSRFCVFWIRKTIRKVMIVVEVLMMSCQVSEKPRAGPEQPHTAAFAIFPNVFSTQSPGR